MPVNSLDKTKKKFKAIKEAKIIIINLFLKINFSWLAAEPIRIDKNKFSECLSSGKYLPRIQSDTAEARAKGISGTLGFLINNQLIVGAQPYDTFKKVIDVELNK